MSNSKKRKMSRIRAVILSTEMMLLLTAVIMLAITAFFGMSKLVLSQATSTKETVAVIRAEAWDLGDGVAVTMYLQNTGSVDVTVKYAGIEYTHYTTIYRCYIADNSFEDVVIHPGETKVISFAISSHSSGTTLGGTCSYANNINSGSSIYVFAHLDNNNEVGTAVRVNSP